MHFDQPSQQGYWSTPQEYVSPVPFDEQWASRPVISSNTYVLPATPMTDQGEWAPYYDPTTGETDVMYGMQEDDAFAYSVTDPAQPFMPVDIYSTHVEAPELAMRPATADAVIQAHYPHEQAPWQSRLGINGMDGYWQGELSTHRYQAEPPHHSSASSSSTPSFRTHESFTSSSSRPTAEVASTFVIPRTHSNTSVSSLPAAPRRPLIQNVPRVSRALTYGRAESLSQQEADSADGIGLGFGLGAGFGPAVNSRQPISVRRQQRAAATTESKSSTKVLKTFTLPASPMSNTSSPTFKSTPSFQRAESATMAGRVEPFDVHSGQSSRRSSLSQSAPTTPSLRRSGSGNPFDMDVDTLQAPSQNPTAQLRTPRTPVFDGMNATMPTLPEENMTDAAPPSASNTSIPVRRHNLSSNVDHVASVIHESVKHEPLTIVFEPVTFDKLMTATQCPTRQSKKAPVPRVKTTTPTTKVTPAKRCTAESVLTKESTDHYCQLPKKGRTRVTRLKGSPSTPSTPPALTDSPFAGPVETKVPPANDDDDRIFVCGEPDCRKRFKRHEHLVRHERFHTQEKPYSCDICHRDFTRRDNMFAHRKSHDKKTVELETPTVVKMRTTKTSKSD
ncbi:hypothetical protein OIO90_003883 [Microbotryomycetes sp. JL221]|nr:hypothetical protein OIO90_003883 [Microbotryomycetes sp. JL221]